MECPAKDTYEAPTWKQYPVRMGNNLQNAVFTLDQRSLCGVLSPKRKIYRSMKLESRGRNDPTYHHCQGPTVGLVFLCTQLWDLQGRGSVPGFDTSFRVKVPLNYKQ